VIVPSNENSHNLQDAAKLWEESERITGIKFNFKTSRASTSSAA
jgi:hypothetical protein